MPKTIESEINEATEKTALWAARINDTEAQDDLKKTKIDCIALANYYEGYADALIRVRDSNIRRAK